MKKRDFILTAFIIIAVITAVSVIREQEAIEVKVGLQEENDKLVEQVSDYEKEFEKSSNTSKELEKENTRYAGQISLLKEEVEVLKSDVVYQDFLDAKETVEAYKEVETFGTASLFMARGVGKLVVDREGSCPCLFSFSALKSIVWKSNAVLGLRKFSMEDEKLLLTYNTVEEFEDDYQFVMTKKEGWKIKEITLKAKGN
ncbi:MAG: hypothetical protein ACQEV7_03095 [Bacillota bacterium]